MMRGKSKADTLDLLDSYGMNTVERIVLRKPFKAENVIVSLMKLDHDPISVRTWKRGEILCPFYPNRSVDDLLQIINNDWDKLKKMDEIIIAQGIDPDRSGMAGKVLDQDTSIWVEYFEGPGTVRKLDTITPLQKMFPKKGVILKPEYGMAKWVSLYIAAKAFFRDYPGTTIEWSYYPYKIGKKKENYIYWEVI